MNKYEVNMTQQFKIELDRIYCYINFNLNAPNTANNLFKKIQKEVETLNHSPERYSKIYYTKNFEKQNLRKMIINKYVVVYQVDNFNKKVFLLHIFHGSQDYLNKI